MGAVERRHAAEAAVQGAAARRLDGSEGVSLGEQIVSRDRDIAQIGPAAFVARVQASVSRVFKDAGPHSLGLSRDDGIRMLPGFVLAHRRVDASEHDRHAEAPEKPGDFVGAIRLRREGSDSHEVRPGHALVVRHAEILVDDRDVPFRRGQAREHQEAERLPYAVTIPAAFLDSDDVDEGIRRIDQVQFHNRHAFVGERFLFVGSSYWDSAREADGRLPSILRSVLEPATRC